MVAAVASCYAELDHAATVAAAAAVDHQTEGDFELAVVAAAVAAVVAMTEPFAVSTSSAPSSPQSSS